MSHSGMTGREAAERLLRGAAIYDVRVEYVSGKLTDHYDPVSYTHLLVQIVSDIAKGDTAHDE